MKITFSFVCAFLTFLGSVGAVDPLKRSLFLPRQDMVSSAFDGKAVFKQLDPTCYNQDTSFGDKEVFYRKSATDSGLSVDHIGPYTMGATFNMKTPISVCKHS